MSPSFSVFFIGARPLAKPKSILIHRLIVVAEAHCAASGQSRASVAKTIFGRGGHFEDLESGARDLATGTFEKAMAWFSANWPEGAEWPEGVERPQPEPAP